MRLAYNDVGWLEHPAAEAGQAPIFGFSLGYDFCAEHEFGASAIKQALGIAEVEHPMGVAARTMTRLPAELGFEVYVWKSKDRRFKKGMPAALLYCSREPSYANTPPTTPRELVAFFRADFSTDAYKDTRWYRPGLDDIVSTWSGHGGFAIHVRGEENVQRLRELHAAFQRHDVSVADATIMGFRRKALSLVINSRLPENVVAEVLANDEAHFRLHEAARQTGIHAELKAAGKGWYALAPQWQDQEGSELLFFLNPKDQKRYDSGWFTLAELREWAQEQGPVVQSHAISTQVKAQDPDWGIHLLQGLKAHGVGMRRSEKFVWLDPAQERIGVKLNLVASRGENKPALSEQGARMLAHSEVFELDEVLPFIQEGRSIVQREREHKSVSVEGQH